MPGGQYKGCRFLRYSADASINLQTRYHAEIEHAIVEAIRRTVHGKTCGHASVPPDLSATAGVNFLSLVFEVTKMAGQVLPAKLR